LVGLNLQEFQLVFTGVLTSVSVQLKIVLLLNLHVVHLIGYVVLLHKFGLIKKVKSQNNLMIKKTKKLIGQF